jgi:hypothetical protein
MYGTTNIKYILFNVFFSSYFLFLLNYTQSRLLVVQSVTGLISLADQFCSESADLHVLVISPKMSCVSNLSYTVTYKITFI